MNMSSKAIEDYVLGAVLLAGVAYDVWIWYVYFMVCHFYLSCH